MTELRFVDSSVFLRYLLDDDGERKFNSLELLRKIESGTVIATTASVALFEVIFTLEKNRRLPKSKIRDAISHLLSLPGFKFAESALFVEALDWYVEKNVPFGDAYIAASMKRQSITEIYTWDSHFDRVPGIVRLTPGAE